MAMYGVKYVLQQYGRSWSYNFYWEGSSAKAAVENAAAVRTDLMKPHNKNTTLVRIEASEISGQLRESWYQNFGAGGGGNITNVPDVVSTAAMCYLGSDDGKKWRNIFVRGLRDADVTRGTDGEDIKGSQLNTDLPLFFGAIKTARFKARRLKRPTEAGYEWVPVGSLVPEPDSDNTHTIVTTRQPHGFPEGSEVMFRFDRSEPALLGFRGHHRPVSIAPGPDGDTLILGVRFRFQSQTIVPANMFARRIGYDFMDITSGGFQKFTSRDTGVLSGPKGAVKGKSYRR